MFCLLLFLVACALVGVSFFLWLCVFAIVLFSVCFVYCICSCFVLF